ncbi:MAG: hypothetical protein Q9166_007403 [cf. Caloplaca sp. 2 TL-2023]
MKPISIYWRDQVPNPFKVLIILEELGLPYLSKWVELEHLKKEPYESVNPNGRVPAIHDPNTETTLFESNAIITYLIATYDSTHTLSYPSSSPLVHQINQWSYFQASGQGPYFGQFAWFHLFHHEKLPSAESRYAKEILRVVGVLEKSLHGKQWLVGEKCTWADLAFLPWNLQIAFFLQGREGDELWDIEKFPNFKGWQDRMLGMDGVERAMGKMMDKEVKSEGKR